MRKIACLTITLFAAGACGQSEASRQAEQVAQANNELAKAGDQLAKDLAAGKMPSGPVVSADKLVSVLPELPGWEKGEPKSETVTAGMTMTLASVEYSKGDSSIRLEISDSSANQLLLAPYIALTKTNVSERTDNGYRKTVTVGGSPGFEEWDGPGNSAEVMVIVGGRFVVKAKSYSVPDATSTRQAVEAVDARALAALK